jgi:hypothetical protein
MKKKYLKIKNKKTDQLKWWEQTYDEASQLARWICLFEAVNMIADKAEEKKLSFDKLDIKPLAIYKYMEATENIILKKVLEQLYNIEICYSEENLDTTNYSYEKEKEYVY